MTGTRGLLATSIAPRLVQRAFVVGQAPVFVVLGGGGRGMRRAGGWLCRSVHRAAGGDADRAQSQFAENARIVGKELLPAGNFAGPAKLRRRLTIFALLKIVAMIAIYLKRVVPSLDDRRWGASDMDRRRVSTNEEMVMKDVLGRFAGDERGTSAIEYSILASGIAVAIVLAVNSLGTQVNASFTGVANLLR